MQRSFCLAHISSMIKLLKGRRQLCPCTMEEKISLDKLRFQRFKENVVRCSKEIQAPVLPQPSGVAKYHSLRVFHKISEWKGESVNATEYGWKEKHGKFILLRTDLPPAPDHLLEVIHCSCKTGSSILKCTCRRNGLECTFACGDFKGTSCSNAKAIETEVVK